MSSAVNALPASGFAPAIVLAVAPLTAPGSATTTPAAQASATAALASEDVSLHDRTPISLLIGGPFPLLERRRTPWRGRVSSRADGDGRDRTVDGRADRWL